MPGSTVYVTNLPPVRMTAQMAQVYSRFVDGHTNDENAKALITGFIADGRSDLALTVLLIAVLGDLKNGHGASETGRV